MDTTALIVWQSFLRTSPADRRTSLLRCVSPELSAELDTLPALSFDPREGFEPLEEELSRIHYSWLAPFLRSLPENEIKLFLSSLTPEQIKGLKQSLLLSNMLPTPSPLGKSYLKKTLFEMIAAEDLLPISCLPEDPLNGLLDLSQTELASLIDLLSMHDLSIEIRHIIETSKLKEINSLLTKAQTTFLKTLLHKKEPVSFKKMGLLGWKGDKDGLRSMLLQRGINRIAKSLYGKNASLLWHVAHRLDAEKGQLLIKLCTALDHPRASALLSDQVVELMSALKNNNPQQNL
ncbi:MAG: hypothetical protein JSS60_00545 [Verrucomicrobia bacterium]|nr:hypothetical protein [Verrucomicrobiota bacterium]